MAFSALTPQEVSPDQPVSTTLLDKVRTNFDDHEARLSASAGIVGEILNGSFETAQGGNPNWPDKWAIGQYSGGQVLLDSDSVHGKKSLKMIHSVSGGGGGYAESDYVAVSPLYMPPLVFAYYGTAPGCPVEVWCRYYGQDGSNNPGTFLGERCIYQNNTGNPMVWSGVQIATVPMAYNGTRYVKYRFIGGVNGSTTTGSVWFDAVGVPIRRVYYPFDNPNPINLGVVAASYPQGWVNAGGAFNITIPAGFRWLVVQAQTIPSSQYDIDGNIVGGPAYARFFLNGVAGKYSTEAVDSRINSAWTGWPPTPPNNAPNWAMQDLVYDLTGVAPGVYALQFQIQSTAWGYNNWLQSPSAINLRHDCRSGLILANGSTLAFTDAYNSQPTW